MKVPKSAKKEMKPSYPKLEKILCRADLVMANPEHNYFSVELNYFKCYTFKERPGKH